MRIRYVRCVVLAGLTFSACGDSPTEPTEARTFVFDFAGSPQGWTAGVSDYRAGAGQAGFVADYRPLPSALMQGRSALFISGAGEGLFMFYKSRASGLRPGVTYRAEFDVEIATGVPNNCVGAGGAPGEGTYVKAGASDMEPLSILLPDGWYRMNINKGDFRLGGTNAVTLGDIANSVSCEATSGELYRTWEFKQLSSGSQGVQVQANADGSVWFVVGTDQDFFGVISLYYTRFVAKLTPQ